MEKEKHNLLYRVAKYCWYTSGLRTVVIYFNLKKSCILFYKNIIFFEDYLRKNSLDSKATVDSLPKLKPSFADPPFADLLEPAPGVFIDFDKIKTLDDVSVKLYEAGSLRIGKLSNKEQIGITFNKAAWRQGLKIDATAGKAITRHETVCLVIRRVVTNSFALQLFDLFLAFIYLECLRKRGLRVETLLLDNKCDKSSALYITSLPACHSSEEFEGVHRFDKIVFLPQIISGNLHGDNAWRTVLLTCGKAEAFHRFLLSAFDVSLPAAPVERVTTITLIRRKKYITDSNKPCGDRIIENEDEIIEILKNNYSQIEVQGVFLERLPLAEQFKLLARSDILISMHGAGLILGGYCLPPNAGMIELFPKYYRIRQAILTCRLIAAERKIHYTRWINHNHKNESGSDTRVLLYRRYDRNPAYNFSVTRVPPAKLIRKIDKLIRKIEGA